MASGNTYSVLVEGSLSGQAIKNVYHYQQMSGTDNADNLFDLFEADVVPKCLDISSASYVMEKVTVTNLEDATDFWIAEIGLNGNFTGENMPTHDAWSFEFITRRTDAKSGGKRIAGVIEGMLNNGVPTFTFALTLGAYMLACERDLTSAGGVWRPCVKGKRRGTLGLFANFISGVSLTGCTTQNSRKFYTN